MLADRETRIRSVVSIKYARRDYYITNHEARDSCVRQIQQTTRFRDLDLTV